MRFAFPPYLRIKTRQDQDLRRRGGAQDVAGDPAQPVPEVEAPSQTRARRRPGG